VSTAYLQKGQGENTEVNSFAGACFFIRETLTFVALFDKIGAVLQHDWPIVSRFEQFG